MKFGTLKDRCNQRLVSLVQYAVLWSNGLITNLSSARYIDKCIYLKSERRWIVNADHIADEEPNC